MKKIINGKVYNTETAELILTLFSGTRLNERDYYMTKKRAFFCHYIRVNDIDLVPEDSMRDLLMLHDAEKYIEIFGDEGIEEG